MAILQIYKKVLSVFSVVCVLNIFKILYIPEMANIFKGKPLVGPPSCVPYIPKTATMMLAKDSMVRRNHAWLNCCPVDVE